ncbi:MAG: TolC family protein [Isosphaeraceae bacterium]|nr:TolC family protein [Isosphaeraceae bacterium]
MKQAVAVMVAIPWAGITAAPKELPMPPLPSRSLPGSIQPETLPPLPDEQANAASFDGSAEPRPSPQSQHIPSPAGKETETETDRANSYASIRSGRLSIYNAKGNPVFEAQIDADIPVGDWLALVPKLLRQAPEAKKALRLLGNLIEIAPKSEPRSPSQSEAEDRPCCEATKDLAARGEVEGSAPGPLASLPRPKLSVPPAPTRGSEASRWLRAADPALTQGLEAQEIWELTLPQAIRIALENSQAIRLVSTGDPELACCEGAKPEACPVQGCGEGREAEPPATITIAPASGGIASPRFKAEVMAMVRSVEQQYWVLAQQQVRLWASEMAVDLGEQVLKREQEKLKAGAGSVPNVTEAQEQLERFRLQFTTATADVITTERQLRNILGLPPADNRRIVPVTAPTEARIQPDWEACLAAMTASQPDIAEQRSQLQLVEMRRALYALNPLIPASTPCGPDGSDEALVRQRALYQQVVHQTTHQLARSFLEVDTGYKRLQAAGHLKEAARKRLEAQRAAYEDGSITINRYLDAIHRWSIAIAQEAEFKCRYNTALAVLEEAKGTLLASGYIIVEGAPDHSAIARPAPRTRDEETRRAAHLAEPVNQAEPAKPEAPPSCCESAKAEAPPSCCESKKQEECSAARAASITPITIRISIGGGSSPLEIRASITRKPQPVAERN